MQVHLAEMNKVLFTTELSHANACGNSWIQVAQDQAQCRALGVNGSLADKYI